MRHNAHLYLILALIIKVWFLKSKLNQSVDLTAIVMFYNFIMELKLSMVFFHINRYNLFSGR